eukprot:3578129-Amphidinium_carterae.2
MQVLRINGNPMEGEDCRCRTVFPCRAGDMKMKLWEAASKPACLMIRLAAEVFGRQSFQTPAAFNRPCKPKQHI